MSIRSLIIEDEYTARAQLEYFLKEYGSCDAFDNGEDGIEAIKKSFKEKKYYDLVCIDIVLPSKNGTIILSEIRKFEKSTDRFITHPLKVIMTTAMTDIKNVSQAYSEFCDGYLKKPVTKTKLRKYLVQFNLI